MVVRKNLPTLTTIQSEERSSMWIFLSLSGSVVLTYCLHNCIICGQIQLQIGHNPSDKGPPSLSRIGVADV